MITHFDHTTIAVRDTESAIRFFELLGFVVKKTLTIHGEKMERYMMIDDFEADHITLELEGATPRLEIQLLKFHSPEPHRSSHIDRLDKLGYNHICFAVDDIEQQVEKLKSHGVKILNDIMTFNKRKLVYIEGPEGVVIELAEWKD